MSGVWLGVNTPRGDCVGLLASLVGLSLFFSVSRGRARTTCTLDRLPMLFRPHAGAIKFGGHLPAGNEIFYFPRRRGFAYFVFRILYIQAPLWGEIT